MSAWTVLTPKPRQPQPRSKRPYSQTADHIRGRVYDMGTRTTRGDSIWGMEVINTRTGKVIASDNCAAYTKVLELCDEATACARAAWFWDFKREAVK